ncbi:TonB-dependent receptor [Asticcacaulis sp. EMRT-3]|uniref:TonB-dependent receptor n=1 Tax=Asticcacaulis sp. EMRT-3 TaxID=3040349 RepID=UPI0024AF7250|nr:TonB-dependent receptor [Asticcacaulis sp. EMRT-3]MDI7775863.1 TonB-dependent receptor [Asticcacaulis sp. EMRT-3]
MSVFKSGALRNLLMSGAAAMTVMSAPAWAQTEKTFQIPAQDATTAVPLFVQQSGLQVLATAEDLKGIRTHAVQGTMTADAALDALIRNTGLSIRTRDGNSAVLMRTAAQTAPASTTTPAATEPDTQEVVVVGMRKSLRDALDIKRRQTGIVEAISSKDIGALPDVTIAEELNRLPGVTTSRDRGNASQASIRGLGTRMVLGTVNGREVASSEPDRSVRWEIYPSEMVAGVEVYKSSEARLISGGISGTIDLRTIRPLDYSGPSLVVRAGPLDYEGGKAFPGYDGMGYRGSLSYVFKPAPNFGVVIGLTSQKQKNGYESVQGWGYNDGADNGAVLAGNATKYNTPWGSQAEGDKLTETRMGASLGMQWKASDNFELAYDLLYSDIKIDEDQDQAWWGNNVWGNWDGGNTQNYIDGAAASGKAPVINSNGDVVAATVTWAPDESVVAKYKEDKTLIVTGLNGKWTTADWTVVADASYSKAERYNSWAADKFQYWPATMSFDFTGKPRVSVSSAPQDNTQTPDAGQWETGHVADTLSAAQVDATRHFDKGFFTSLMFGARVADRRKVLGNVTGTVAALSGVTIDPSQLDTYQFKNFDIPTMLTGDFDAIAQQIYGRTLHYDPKAEPDSDRVEEKVAEAYIEGAYATNWGSIPVDGNFGVRVLDVKTDSHGTSTQAGDWVETPPGSGTWVQQMVTTPVSGGVSYTKLLPSATARLDFGNGHYLKLSAAEVVSRPPLNDMIITRQISASAPYTGSSGNPYLQPFEATQLDASYEWYFSKDSLFALAGYYKDVKHYIGYASRNETINGNAYTLTSPVNASKGGYISGLELTYQTPFSFIPGGEHFGIYSNYAYVSSDLKEMSANLPLNGLAKNTATLDFWYSNHGIDARLGTKYHSTYTAIYGWNDSALVRIRPETTMDFSVSYQMTAHLQVRLQAANLLNTPLKTYENNIADRLGRWDYYGRNFLVDLTFKY